MASRRCSDEEVVVVSHSTSGQSNRNIHPASARYEQPVVIDLTEDDDLEVETVATAKPTKPTNHREHNIQLQNASKRKLVCPSTLESTSSKRPRLKPSSSSSRDRQLPSMSSTGPRTTSANNHLNILNSHVQAGSSTSVAGLPPRHTAQPRSALAITLPRPASSGSSCPDSRIPVPPPSSSFSQSQINSCASPAQLTTPRETSSLAGSIPPQHSRTSVTSNRGQNRRTHPNVIIISSDDERPEPVQYVEKSDVYKNLYLDSIFRDVEATQKAGADADRVFQVPPESDDDFDMIETDFIKPEIPIGTEINRDNREAPKYPSDNATIDQGSNRDEVTERLRRLNINVHPRTGMRVEDVMQIEAFGKDMLMVASGGTSRKLEKYTRSQRAHPSGRPWRVGFQLTGQFTGARPPPPKLNPDL